ncbi:hypothetical protein M9458_037272, partial [Cirrhinus mrigala]
SEEMAEPLYKETKIICVSINIAETLSDPWHKRRQMDDYTVDSTLGARTPCDTGNPFKHDLLYPRLDRMLSELGNGFSCAEEKLMKGIQA